MEVKLFTYGEDCEDIWKCIFEKRQLGWLLCRNFLLRNESL